MSIPSSIYCVRLIPDGTPAKRVEDLEAAGLRPSHQFGAPSAGSTMQLANESTCMAVLRADRLEVV